MTRRVFGSPTYLLAIAALVTGMLMGSEPPSWVIGVALLAVAAAAYSIERWYVDGAGRVVTSHCEACGTVRGRVE